MTDSVVGKETAPERSDGELGRRVWIFETITGNEWGERATITHIGDDIYHVRADDGSLFSVVKSQTRPLANAA